jgi:hypothetical protein
VWREREGGEAVKRSRARPSLEKKKKKGPSPRPPVAVGVERRAPRAFFFLSLSPAQHRQMRGSAGGANARGSGSVATPVSDLSKSTSLVRRGRAAGEAEEVAVVPAARMETPASKSGASPGRPDVLATGRMCGACGLRVRVPAPAWDARRAARCRAGSIFKAGSGQQCDCSPVFTYHPLFLPPAQKTHTERLQGVHPGAQGVT